MKTVPLHGRKAAGRVALVDDGDYDLVSGYRWRIHEQKQPNGTAWGPYARTDGHRDGRRVIILMHQLITGYPKTDHRNGDGLDNQRHNLRPTTTAQNNHNQQPCRGHSSHFKGVTWNKKVSKWQAQIKVSGKSRYLGVFASEEDAARAYVEAALAIQGEYAFASRETPEGAV